MFYRQKYSNLLLVTTYSSKRVLIFSAVILQRDRIVCSGGDICQLIERWLSLWKDGNYNTHMQEAGICDRAPRSSHAHALEDADIVCVFTRCCKARYVLQSIGLLNVLLELFCHLQQSSMLMLLRDH